MTEMTSEKLAKKFHTDDVYYPDQGSASDWLKQISHAARPIRSTTKICMGSNASLLWRHQYGISYVTAPQASIRGETSDGVGKFR